MSVCKCTIYQRHQSPTAGSGRDGRRRERERERERLCVCVCEPSARYGSLVVVEPLGCTDTSLSLCSLSPGSAWGGGRQNFQRSASILLPTFLPSIDRSGVNICSLRRSSPALAFNLGRAAGTEILLPASASEEENLSAGLSGGKVWPSQSWELCQPADGPGDKFRQVGVNLWAPRG